MRQYDCCFVCCHCQNLNVYNIHTPVLSPIRIRHMTDCEYCSHDTMDCEACIDTYCHFEVSLTSQETRKTLKEWQWPAPSYVDEKVTDTDSGYCSPANDDDHSPPDKSDIEFDRSDGCSDHYVNGDVDVDSNTYLDNSGYSAHNSDTESEGSRLNSDESDDLDTASEIDPDDQDSHQGYCLMGPGKLLQDTASAHQTIVAHFLKLHELEDHLLDVAISAELRANIEEVQAEAAVELLQEADDALFKHEAYQKALYSFFQFRLTLGKGTVSFVANDVPHKSLAKDMNNQETDNSLDEIADRISAYKTIQKYCLKVPQLKSRTYSSFAESTNYAESRIADVDGTNLRYRASSYLEALDAMLERGFISESETDDEDDEDEDDNTDSEHSFTGKPAEELEAFPPLPGTSTGTGTGTEVTVDWDATLQRSRKLEEAFRTGRVTSIIFESSYRLPLH